MPAPTTSSEVFTADCRGRVRRVLSGSARTSCSHRLDSHPLLTLDRARRARPRPCRRGFGRVQPRRPADRRSRASPGQVEPRRSARPSAGIARKRQLGRARATCSRIRPMPRCSTSCSTAWCPKSKPRPGRCSTAWGSSSSRQPRRGDAVPLRSRAQHPAASCAASKAMTAVPGDRDGLRRGSRRTSATTPAGLARCRGATRSRPAAWSSRSGPATACSCR